MMCWVIRLISPRGPVQLFLVSASALQQRLWYVPPSLWDGAYKSSLDANRRVAHVVNEDFHRKQPISIHVFHCNKH